MKKIKIVFNGLDFYEAYIFIYDCNNNLLFEGLTCNHKIEVCLEEYNVYKIKAITNNTKLVTSFYINCNSTYRFSFVNSIQNNPITFLLTDYYYDLPIERGELLLWQKQ